MSKGKILYVDDEEMNHRVFRINFEKKYEVVAARNGFEGLKKLGENHDVQVVISDMRMPKMNGIEFIRKAKIEYPKVQFFILTGYNITKEIEIALESRLIAEYFMKPFMVKEIDEAIARVMN